MADYVKLDEEKFIPKSDILSLLRTYNCYHEGKSFQLRHREEEEALVVEGLLNIYWGLRRPIRLQMHDDNERLHYGGVNRNERSQVLPKQTESNNNIPDRATDPALTCSLEEDDEEVPQLLRTRSDASFMGVTRRSKTHGHSDLQHLRSHRFSINGHFYNHKTSVFTPAFGSVTNVRVNSSMTTLQVLNLLLQKFRVENKADEFVLYMVHESGERTPLKDSEYPLVYRVLHGPCEKISKIFIMETDLGEEVTHDVAQYINFEMPVLDSFVEKLKEEEEREISKLTRKYSALKSMILQQLEGITDTTDRV
ncbi:ras association domain-containing protein 4a isoform X1 [Salmo salar]|uniref:Ras association domain-containing protein 4a isoform X1 n=1 Tax=Salmo salar TaxID=8030 RepID=A0A1S3N1P4_SALSA|nr:ras association domain-containing protein 4a isoform X1 [Salmo salar]|eukprot:XP_014009403.1 PREDICTED: ras association domain-containing protein 4 isoform X1 [Salmo salar]